MRNLCIYQDRSIWRAKNDWFSDFFSTQNVNAFDFGMISPFGFFSEITACDPFRDNVM